MIRINGRELADEIIKGIGSRLQNKVLYFVQFGHNKVSDNFIAQKIRWGQKLGVQAFSQKYFVETTEEAILEIERLVEKNPDGIIVQLPLPKNLDQKMILNSVPPEMDIDLLSDLAYQHFLNHQSLRIPPVALAVWQIFKKYNIDFKSKKICILGQGKLVGQAIADLLTYEKIIYQIFNKNSLKDDLSVALKEADIIISGIGVAHFLKAIMIKEGVVLIDAGSSEQNEQILGDIDPECFEKANLYSTVPGGVGPVTVASLFLNLALNIEN